MKTKGSITGGNDVRKTVQHCTKMYGCDPKANKVVGINEIKKNAYIRANHVGKRPVVEILSKNRNRYDDIVGKDTPERRCQTPPRFLATFWMQSLLFAVPCLVSCCAAANKKYPCTLFSCGSVMGVPE